MDAKYWAEKTGLRLFRGRTRSGRTLQQILWEGLKGTAAPLPKPTDRKKVIRATSDKVTLAPVEVSQNLRPFPGWTSVSALV